MRQRHIVQTVMRLRHIVQTLMQLRQLCIVQAVMWQTMHVVLLATPQYLRVFLMAARRAEAAGVVLRRTAAQRGQPSGRGGVRCAGQNRHGRTIAK